MIERYAPFLHRLGDAGLDGFADALRPLIATALHPERHGDLDSWRQVLAALPPARPSFVDLGADCLLVGEPGDIDAATRAQLQELLMALHPWRKGPFCLFGIHIDTEWRSDWKWQRVAPALDLHGRKVLDVGCGNGYYGWRMLGAGAELVVGIDPTLRYVMQSLAIAHYIGDSASAVLPLKLEQLPPADAAFDTVLSMGVLYHRRDPLEHLHRLAPYLRPDGELVLETLVIEGGPGDVVVPEKRYAKMKNVWAVPSVPTVEDWLEQAGYRDIRCIDVSPTTSTEQRRTLWMRFESLADFLDPHDPGRTVEGYPAPIRAVFVARPPCPRVVQRS